MLVTFILPWWTYSSSINVSALGQNLNTGASVSSNGFQMFGFLLGLVGTLGAAYFITQKNKISIWFAVISLAHVVNTYFGLVGNAKADLNMKVGGYGNVSYTSGYTYGFYLYAAGSIILLFMEAKRLGWLNSISIEIDSSKKTETKSNNDQESSNIEPN